MAEVILANDSLTVLGGPASIDVQLDFGPEGDRGSYIYTGEGDPNLPSTVIGQDPAIFDLYINILNPNPNDALFAQTNEDYLALYQYQNIDGENTWVKIVKLIPNTWSSNRSPTFVNGQVQINIPVVSIVSSSQMANLSASDFNIQHNILNSNPTSSALSVGALVTEGDTIVLPLTIKAVEYSGGTWSNLAGQKTVHLFITMV